MVWLWSEWYPSMDLSVGEWELYFVVNILSSWQGFRWAIQGPWVLLFSSFSFCCWFVLCFVLLVDEGREGPNATKRGSSSARQRNTIYMSFRWRADNGPILNAGLEALWLPGGSGHTAQPHPTNPSGSAHTLWAAFWKMCLWWDSLKRTPLSQPWYDFLYLSHMQAGQQRLIPACRTQKPSLIIHSK